MTARRVVRERIDPRLTAALFANYRTPVDAVLELVDNAIDSRVVGRPLELDLAVHPGRLILEVVGGIAERRTRGSKKGAPAVTAGRKRQAGLWR